MKFCGDELLQIYEIIFMIFLNKIFILILEQNFLQKKIKFLTFLYQNCTVIVIIYKKQSY